MDNVIKQMLVSYENSHRLLDRSCLVHENIRDIINSSIVDSHQKAVSELNKMVYDLAEKRKMSIWDICLSTVPSYGFPETVFTKDTPLDQRVEMKMELKLIPLKLELEKGGGYWKDKYYRLKVKMQELIDSKEP